MRNAFKNTSGTRGRKLRDVNRKRKISQPAVPTGIVPRKARPFVMMRPRPKNPLPKEEAKRRTKYKTQLLERYGQDERGRRYLLTTGQHFSETGKIGSEGFRNETTVKGIPYDRDRSPHNSYHGKKRQYAFQNEFHQSKKHRDAAAGYDKGPFRGRRTVYTFRKTQPVQTQVSGD